MLARRRAASECSVTYSVVYPTESFGGTLYAFLHGARKQDSCFPCPEEVSAVILVVLRRVRGKQKPPRREVWRADEYRREARQQPDTSLDVR